MQVLCIFIHSAIPTYKLAVARIDYPLLIPTKKSGSECTVAQRKSLDSKICEFVQIGIRGHGYRYTYRQ